MATGLALLMAVLLLLLGPIAPVRALAAERYSCNGEPLKATFHPGAVDAPAIANSTGGTLPGAFIVLEWQGVNLQLPRTNNAGSPSYTDGRWWWQATDPEHPDFFQLRARKETYDCSKDK